MIIAKVKWWNDTKGFGFLEVDGQDVFAHYTAIISDGFRTLEEGSRVACELVDGPKGPQAMNIQRLTDSNSVTTEVLRFMEAHA